MGTMRQSGKGVTYEKVFQTGIQGQDRNKPQTVADQNSMIGGVNKYFHYFTHVAPICICCKKYIIKDEITRLEFQKTQTHTLNIT
jgi:hypothetical protein